MKSLRCWPELVDPLTLWRAWRDFEHGKRRRPAVAAFALDADREVHRLARELQAGTYWPGPYRLLRISEPKRRIVAAAPIRDRVVHHALYRLLAPAYTRSFVDSSFACLPGRGSHRAILRFRGELRRWRFVLKLDIRRYFYSIVRATLRKILCRRLPEPRLQLLLGRILESGARLYSSQEVVSWLGWEEPGSPGRGLPIGNLTSQWWGNVYLDGLDHMALRVLRVGSYQRYMDDMTIFGDNAGELVDVREQVAAWLLRERGLFLKDPHAEPETTRRQHLYLGYLVSRGGISLGPKARQRLPTILGSKVDDPRSLAAAVQSVGSLWMFGSGG